MNESNVSNVAQELLAQRKNGYVMCITKTARERDQLKAVLIEKLSAEFCGADILPVITPHGFYCVYRQREFDAWNPVIIGSKAEIKKQFLTSGKKKLTQIFSRNYPSLQVNFTF